MLMGWEPSWETIFAAALCIKCIQYRLLVGIGLDVKSIGGGIRPTAPPAFPIDRQAEFFLIFLWLVGDEILGVPIGLEGRAHFIDDVRLVLCRHFHIPLHPFCDGSVGKIDEPM